MTSHSIAYAPTPLWINNYSVLTLPPQDIPKKWCPQDAGVRVDQGGPRWPDCIALTGSVQDLLCYLTLPQDIPCYTTDPYNGYTHTQPQFYQQFFGRKMPKRNKVFRCWFNDQGSNHFKVWSYLQFSDHRLATDWGDARHGIIISNEIEISVSVTFLLDFWVIQ